jgi:hypothetical protein
MEHKVNPDLERYLRLAAWGLPHKKRLEVKRELRGNIEMLAQEYQIQGHSQQQALELALRDFGAPERVCVGMGKVYIMPTIFRNAALMALVATLSISTLNSSTAQVTGTMIWPTPECANNDTFKVGPYDLTCDSETIWIHLPSLRATLEPLGVRIKEYISRPGEDKTTILEFPGATNNIMFKEPKIRYMSIEDKLFEHSTDTTYVMGSSFFHTLLETLLPIRISGWDNPTLSVGKTSFRLGTEQKVFKGLNVYNSFLWNVVSREVPQPDKSIFMEQSLSGKVHNKPSELYIQNIELPQGNPDDVFILISRELRDLKRPAMIQIRRTTKLNATKGIEFYSRAKNITFTKNPNLKPVQPNGNGEAILYRFTGRIDKNSLEVVPPEQIKILK